MSLRDHLVADLGSVFLPLTSGSDTGFDSLHTLDDEYEVACILDETDSISIAGTARSAEFSGVSTYQATLYVRSDDYAAPVVDQRIKIDERYAVVVNVAEVEGLRVIRLRWWAS